MDLLKAHAPAAEKALGQLLKIGGLKVDDAAGMERETLLDTASLVTVRSNCATTVPAHFVIDANPKDLGMEASAMWPLALQLQVPGDWKVGDKVPAQGPHGRIFLELPEGCKRGTTARLLLKPEPEMSIVVPPGASPGSSLVFERPDGTRITIKVPPGKKAGDQFDVTPPALMVLVPEEAKAGDNVVFHLGPEHGKGCNQWFQARVPKKLQLGRYLAARLPPPENFKEQMGKEVVLESASSTADEEVGQILEHSDDTESDPEANAAIEKCLE